VLASASAAEAAQMGMPRSRKRSLIYSTRSRSCDKRDFAPHMDALLHLRRRPRTAPGSDYRLHFGSGAESRSASARLDEGGGIFGRSLPPTSRSSWWPSWWAGS
jgi:hypothetical protein